MKKGYDQVPSFWCQGSNLSHLGWLSLLFLRIVEAPSMNINNVFLNGVHMSQPHGFVDPNYPPHYVCKLRKAICCLKQAPQVWFHTLIITLCSMGFTRYVIDSSPFCQFTVPNLIFLFLYIDDIVITGGDENAIHDLIQHLHQNISLKYLRLLNYFLSLELITLANGNLLLTQTTYIMDLLCKAKMDSSKHIGSPMLTSPFLSAIDGAPVKNPILFKSIEGVLQYITLTKPELTFPIIRYASSWLDPLMYIGVRSNVSSNTSKGLCILKLYLNLHLSFYLLVL